ncbi:putative myb-related protein Myb4-like [Capsicum annuum]|uniref:B-box domain protein 30-like n=1 Tax=Capsicum annuum TaxID=4072 RepID=UPI001FB19568|nr:B-box domain protein 30-like [Capsicum annuum]KAF3613731.1 putative myb-related protein Myb4-like [Capsicum annuum]KAF3613827.1 putative myb-related protein Myb4-like [Capsicum annuum]
MCRGSKEGEEESPPISFCKGPLEEGQESTIVSTISCELCKSEASVYCQADNAFLCWKCDKWVHAANFLARRHIRCLLCGVCRRLMRRFLIGASSEVDFLASVGLVQRRSRRNEDCEVIVRCGYMWNTNL